jgi:16S rRNA processing protein RimM
MANSGFVPVGKVIKAHGLKGELCISSYADSPFPFQDLARVYLKVKGKHPKKHGILDSRITAKGVLLTLEFISGRDKAEQWLGAEVWVRSRDVPEAEKEAVRRLELLDMAVYLKNGRHLGSIVSVSNRPDRRCGPFGPRRVRRYSCRRFRNSYCRWIRTIDL